MKILVTGGAGYIGSTLVPILLGQDHQVRVLDCLMHGGQSMLGFWSNPGFDFLKGDVRDQETIAKALEGMDAVVHLAAIVGDPACARQPELAREINEHAALSILDQSVRASVQRFVFASTCSNYGQAGDPDRFADESWELKPLSLYAETKVSVEEAILDRQVGKFSPTVLRFATVFGVSPRMRFDLTVNEFTLDMILKGELAVYGEQFWRPYVHVRDAARAVATVLSTPVDVIGNQVFNVGSTEQNYQKQQLVELIKPHAPAAKIEYVHKEEDPRDYRVSFEKIKQTLGFRVQHTVEDGIGEVAELVKYGVIDDFTHPRFRN